MKKTLVLTAAFATTFVAFVAWPCGMPFGVGVNVDAKQDIIVVHKNGVETYVFQPTFCGTASNFGLILPVPSKLTEQPALAKAEVFKYVETISQPQIVKTTECRPKLGDAGALGGSSGSRTLPNATVVASGRVGFLDWAQLKADTTASFTDWLDSNGFPHQTSANDAFAYYVQKGWYFVAFKIAQETTGTRVCNALGPVKLSFTAEVPVVPSRMATAGSSDTTAVSSPRDFTWRIFGISAGTDQIGFVNDDGRLRTLGFSGQLTADDVTHLDGLAVENDRLTKLGLWFGYTGYGVENSGLTEDVALSVATAKDFREIKYDTTYVDCLDGGVPPDATSEPKPVGSGCSFARANATAASTLPLLLGLGLLGWARRRRR